MFRIQLSTKLLELAEPISDKIKQYIRNLMTRFQSWKLKHSNFKVKFTVAKIVPESEVRDPKIIIPNSVIN